MSVICITDGILGDLINGLLQRSISRLLRGGFRRNRCQTVFCFLGNSRCDFVHRHIAENITGDPFMNGTIRIFIIPAICLGIIRNTRRIIGMRFKPLRSIISPYGRTGSQRKEKQCRKYLFRRFSHAGSSPFSFSFRISSCSFSLSS